MARPVDSWLTAITKRGRREGKCPDQPFQKYQQNGSDPGAECKDDAECVVSVKCKISFESRRDHLGIETEAHIELGPSPLGGIAIHATLIIPAQGREQAENWDLHRQPSGFRWAMNGEGQQLQGMANKIGLTKPRLFHAVP